MSNTIEIFRAGTHTDSQGRTRSWTEEDLDRIVRTYNEQNEHEAPIVIGHPQDNHPAYGWVKSLRRAGDRVLAVVDQLVPEFTEAVRQGLYKKRSASFYATGLLRHVGFLGAQPPAVKGLSDVSFSGAAEMTIEFSEDYRWNFRAVKAILSRLRDWLIETKDLDTADRLINPWELDSIIPPEQPLESGQFTDPPDIHQQLGEPTMALDSTALAERIAQLEADNATLKNENAAIRATQSQQEREQRLVSIRSFLESPEMQRRLPSDSRTALVDIMAAIDGQEMDYAERADTAPVRVPVADRLRTVLATLPEMVEFGEVVRTTSTPSIEITLSDSVNALNARNSK